MQLFTWEPVENAHYRYDYGAVVDDINLALQEGDEARAIRIMRVMGADDLFFLLYFILDVKPVNHPWVVARIREVEEVDNRTLDLWSREHFKSTIISWARNIQRVIRNPEERIGIFSHTRALAKAHLRRIKQVLESNRLLPIIYPDIFYDDPKSESSKWSEDDGLICKRKGSFLEATFEAWGLVDGMPTGKHFSILNYDDVVTRESVTTPEQIDKVRECFGLSLNLGTRGGIQRIIGTRYHFKDLYDDLIKRGNWIVREHPCEDPVTKEPFLLTREELDEKYLDMGPYVYAAQMLLNPVAAELQEFKPEWLRHWFRLPTPLNYYITVDPAHSKKKGSDYTVIAVIGVDRLGNHYLVDVLRARLALHERWEALRDMVMRYPQAIRIGYEEYGMQSDREYIERMQQEEGVYFKVIPLRGKLKKEERIRGLVPLFSAGKFFLPTNPIMQDGKNLVQVFIEDEYQVFPYSRHDDMLDAISRILSPDMKVQRPLLAGNGQRRRNTRRRRGTTAWSV